MKPHIVRTSQILTAAFSLAFLPAVAYSLETPQTITAQAGISVPAPKPAPKTVWMSHEAAEVLKLVRANVTEDVVMAFIENSRTGFNLSADEIVQLHNDGVSDKMIQAMLARKKAAPPVVAVAQEAPQPQAQPTPQQQIVVQQPAQPTVTYVPSEPVYVTAPTTTYVYREPYYSYYDSYPYYWGFYPRVSFNFGFRSGYYGGHYRYGGSWGHYAPIHHYGGGFHGGYAGGGWHGGGGFHGGHHR